MSDNTDKLHLTSHCVCLATSNILQRREICPVSKSTSPNVKVSRSVSPSLDYMTLRHIGVGTFDSFPRTNRAGELRSYVGTARLSLIPQCNNTAVKIHFTSSSLLVSVQGWVGGWVLAEGRLHPHVRNHPPTIPVGGQQRLLEERPGPEGLFLEFYVSTESISSRTEKRTITRYYTAYLAYCNTYVHSCFWEALCRR